jgi:hypothetical protein
VSFFETLTLCPAATRINFTIPEATPSGQYLVRIEHIGLHVAQSANGAQVRTFCLDICSSS